MNPQELPSLRPKLDRRLAFRSFSRQSRTAIADALRKFAPQTFAVLWYPDDQECHNLAELLAITLRDSGWVLNQSGGEWLGFSLILGVRIEFAPTKADELSDACNAFAFELNKIGIVAEVNGNPELDKPEKLPTELE